MSHIRASSIRTRSPADTLVFARQLGAQLGISRVTDISGLDTLGIPVFASVNPTLKVDQVTYGKGATDLDAQVGAFMESIEFSIAQEQYPGEIRTRWGTPLQVSGADQQPDTILNFCPLANSVVNLEQPLLLASAERVGQQQPALIPAELVYFPVHNPGQRLFGSNTNGLASGNTLLEASVHALYELIERDIASFQTIHPSGIKIANHSLPDTALALLEKITSAGFELSVHYVKNQFQVGFFIAHLWHPERICNKFFCAGWGCHLSNEIALNRAICEAAQSHTAAIHGARNFSQSIEHNPNLALQINREHGVNLPCRPFEQLPQMAFGGLDWQWQYLQQQVKQVTQLNIFRAVFTGASAPLQVVRVVAPGLENFRPDMMRVGRRLKHYLEHMA